MNHFLHDNPDLGFYIDQWIRWEEMHPLVGFNSADEDGFESSEEAKSFIEKCWSRSAGSPAGSRTLRGLHGPTGAVVDEWRGSSFQ